MKLALQKPRYLIVIGLTVFLCIIGIILFTGSLVEKRMTRISEFAGAILFKQKLSVFNYEFNNILNINRNAVKVFEEGKGPYTEELSDENLQKTLRQVVLAEKKVNRAWYAVVKGRDTSFFYLVRNKEGVHKAAMPDEVKTWAKQQFFIQNGPMVRSSMSDKRDTLHWLTASDLLQSPKGKLIFGLDINLQELRLAFYDIDPITFTFGFLVDENGVCIYSPYEKVIGKKLYQMRMEKMNTRVIGGGKIRSEKAMSDSIQIPVKRYYIPNAIVGLKWTLVVDVPSFLLEEDVTAIKNYSVYLGLIAVSIIIGLIWLYQRRWQKEFIIRREVEINLQELSMEKQALNLIAERQQKENALLQLGKLKEKVNPHFLFNSLSSLNALIAQDPDLAKSFVVKLSRVYRYVLESYPNGLATVEEELRFMNEYFFLLKIRFGEGLEPLTLQISEAHLQGKIPFMSLQTLIENAVKHNILSKSNPLKIRIESLGEGIMVSNNLQIRPDVRDSGKQGLNYLQSTYAYFGNQQLKYGVEGDQYQCFLPVLYLTE